MSALSTLHKWPDLKLILWGDGSMAQLLKPGRHELRPMKGLEGPICGLVPLSGPATMTTQGLQWNLGKLHCTLSLKDWPSKGKSVIRQPAIT